MPDLKIKIFADGADLTSIKKHTNNSLVKGFTTNPTLMRKAGVTDYKAFAKEALSIVGNLPISFEVFADEPNAMAAQAKTIADWGDNVYVKIPIMMTDGTPTYNLINHLTFHGVKVNVTAVFTIEQIRKTYLAVHGNTPNIISVFAGRIADAGGDFKDIMTWASTFLSGSSSELLWASPRQVYDVVLAQEYGAKIITVTDDILNKIPNLGKDLTQFSQETCQMFRNDAVASGFSL